jgi:hypothetical protein
MQGNMEVKLTIDEFFLLEYLPDDGRNIEEVYHMCEYRCI